MGESGDGQLSTRADVDGLLVAFYSVAMTDDLLGPVFVAARLDLLHERIPLTPAMFARWLELWSGAVDHAYRGPVAEEAKATARRVAEAMQRQLAGGSPLLQLLRP